MIPKNSWKRLFRAREHITAELGCSCKSKQPHPSFRNPDGREKGPSFTGGDVRLATRPPGRWRRRHGGGCTLPLAHLRHGCVRRVRTQRVRFVILALGYFGPEEPDGLCKGFLESISVTGSLAFYSLFTSDFPLLNLVIFVLLIAVGTDDAFLLFSHFPQNLDEDSFYEVWVLSPI